MIFLSIDVLKGSINSANRSLVAQLLDPSAVILNIAIEILNYSTLFKSKLQRLSFGYVGHASDFTITDVLI